MEEAVAQGQRKALVVALLMRAVVGPRANATLLALPRSLVTTPEPTVLTAPSKSTSSARRNLHLHSMTLLPWV